MGVEPAPKRRVHKMHATSNNGKCPIYCRCNESTNVTNLQTI